MFYEKEEIEAAQDFAQYAMVELAWMKLRNELWLAGIVELCHTGK